MVAIELIGGFAALLLLLSIVLVASHDGTARGRLVIAVVAVALIALVAALVVVVVLCWPAVFVLIEHLLLLTSPH